MRVMVPILKHLRYARLQSIEICLSKKLILLNEDKEKTIKTLSLTAIRVGFLCAPSMGVI